MKPFVFTFAAALALLTACDPSSSSDDETLITFYEDSGDTADSEITTDISDDSDETTDDSEDSSDSEDVDDSSDDDTADTDTASIEDCASYTEFSDQMLCQHNYIRAYGTDPEPDTPLEPLTWSTDLEDIARNYAEGCVFEHNEDRSDTVSGTVGENIAAATWEATGVYVVNMWASEVEYYDYETNSCEDGEQCGHYTQIVWDDTTEVGCAVNYCNSLENFNSNSGAYFYVCNYSPSGNYNNTQPY